MFQTIWQSAGLVFISEMGDKTQLLALILVTRFRQPFSIMAGILAATLLNHGLAAWFGSSLSQWIDPKVMKIILSISFVAFALWVLVPDKDDGLNAGQKSNAFLTTLVTFFLAEMGDKTQLATVALAARFQEVYLVTFGTTLGMMGADGLAVFFGDKIQRKLPLQWIRRLTALSFLAFALALWLSP